MILLKTINMFIPTRSSKEHGIFPRSFPSCSGNNDNNLSLKIFIEDDDDADDADDDDNAADVIVVLSFLLLSLTSVLVAAFPNKLLHRRECNIKFAGGKSTPQ